MILRKITRVFGINGSEQDLPTYMERILWQQVPQDNNPTTPRHRQLLSKVLSFFSLSRCLANDKSDEEQKVYCWLNTMASTHKSYVFEYVNSTERGLSFNEANERLKKIGPNIPVDNPFSTWWEIFWNALWHPFNIILFVVSALCFIANDKPNGSIMFSMVILSVSLRFYQELSSSKAALKLSELVKASIKVQRCAGKVVQNELQVQLDQKDIVPGDIVIFTAGDLFPGDVRVLSSKALVVSQSSLTGESGVVEKTADIIEESNTPILELRNICLMGTSVVSGSGSGLVVSTRNKTYISTILSTLRKKSAPDAFEKGVRSISYMLICSMLVVVPIVITVEYFTKHDLGRSFLFGITVAVGLTPQMLPLIVNTNLAKGALAMARDKCIVKKMVAIQNMGAMDVLCTDKTGTLTMDRLILVNHLDSLGEKNEKILYYAFLNSYFQTSLKNPLDDGIMAFVYGSGFRFDQVTWDKIDEEPFDFNRRRMSVMLERNNQHAHLSNNLDKLAKIIITKGAYEEVLAVCSNFQVDFSKENIEFLSAAHHQRLLNMGKSLSENGLRVLGVAVRKLKSEVRCSVGMIEEHMTFLGFLAFYDPPKESVKEALWRLAEKGVKVKVLTGDNLPVAIKVCKEVGMRTTNVITGPELSKLDEMSFNQVVQNVTVLAKLTPSQKLQVVQSLKSRGHIVGFLGDGINDSLALKNADVGISVDSGASVAKDSADIILLEKDLNVLAAGVERGRITHGNSMKYIKLATMANIGTVISLVVSTSCLPFDPLTPNLLLTQYLFYDIMQFFIPWDKMDPEYVRLPQKWSAKDIATFLLWNGPVCSLFDISTLLFLIFYYDAVDVQHKMLFQSAWFVEGVILHAFIIHVIRTQQVPFVQRNASWPITCATLFISLSGILLPYTPIGKTMGLFVLPFSFFGFTVINILSYFVLSQLIRKAYIHVHKRWL